jgi:protein disulfide-isomerase A1
LGLVVSVLSHGGHDHDHHDHDHDHDHEDHDHVSETLVVALDPSTFDDHIKANELTLVEFYAPWCGHCKALAPEYDAASLMLKDQGSLAKVDCTIHRDLCSKYEVQGFPTLKLFRNDDSDPMDYDSARKADAITKFMLKQKQAAFAEPKTQGEIDKLAASEFSVVAYISADDKEAIDAFVSIAKALRNEYEFGLVTDASLAGSAKRPTATIHRKFDEPQVHFDFPEFNKDTLVDFIIDNAFPLLGTIGPDNYQKYVERGLPLAWFFVNMEADQAIMTTAAEIAKEYKSSISFVKLDGVRWADHAKTFGLSGETPGIVIEDRDNHKNYVFSGVPTLETLTAYFKSFHDGALAPTVKSEEPPASNDGPVKIIVGKTFDSIVMDTTKDVLVEFYAPWCGHCKSLTPKYEKLGLAFKAEPSIVIAKVDATENDTPADIKGFPTLIFYPANDKDSPVTYDGERSEGAMEKWIRAHATTLSGTGAAEHADKLHVDF